MWLASTRCRGLHTWCRRSAYYACPGCHACAQHDASAYPLCIPSAASRSEEEADRRTIAKLRDKAGQLESQLMGLKVCGRIRRQGDIKLSWCLCPGNKARQKGLYVKGTWACTHTTVSSMHLYNSPHGLCQLGLILQAHAEVTPSSRCVVLICRWLRRLMQPV